MAIIEKNLYQTELWPPQLDLNFEILTKMEMFILMISMNMIPKLSDSRKFLGRVKIDWSPIATFNLSSMAPEKRQPQQQQQQQ